MKNENTNSYLDDMLKKGATYDQIIPINTASYAELVERLRTEPKKASVVTGIADFDELIGGFEAGRLYVLSAPTKQGKTTFAQTLMYHMARQKTPSMIFSYEMGWEEITQKFWAMDKQTYPPTNLPIYLPLQLHRGGDSLHYQWLFEAIAKAKLERGVQFVVIDHLHFLLPLQDFRNTSFILGGIVREIRRMATTIQIPIVLICHVAKIKDDKIPDWTDIRDSSFITQEADVVLMMYRVKNKDAPRKVSQDTQTDTYTNKAILSMELDRVKGRSKKITLWNNGILFEPYMGQDTILEANAQRYV